MSNTKETAHRYTGAPGVVGRHGHLKKGDVVFLNEQETNYVARNSQRDFARISSDELAKLDKAAIVRSAPTGDERTAPVTENEGANPEGETTGTEATDEAAEQILQQEIADTAELLAEQHSVKELKDLCAERGVDVPKTAKTGKAIAELLAPKIVEENRAAAAAADKPADQQ